MSDDAATSGLVLVRARLVDACGHPWASTLVPLAFHPRHPISHAKGWPWHDIIDRSRATLEEETHGCVERWAAQTRATIDLFVRHVAGRARRIEASIRADQRRTPLQPGLFVPGTPPAATAAREDHGAAGWVAAADAMTLECEVVLGASLRVRPPAAERSAGAVTIGTERP